MQRDPRLRGLSSEHHHALVLARRAPSIPIDELRAQFDREIAPHFAVEEELLLPALRASSPELVERTERDHEAIRAALAEGEPARFAELLVEHVRFEERTLFPVCETLPAALLAQVEARSPH